MNLCVFSGRLTRDAQTRYTGTGTPVTNFAIAVDTGWGENKKTEFIDCAMWKREALAQHLTKGKPVTLYGEYGTRLYTDKNGVERKVVEITVRDVEFQQGQPAQPQGAPRPQPRVQHAPYGEYQPEAGPEFPTSADGMDDTPF